VRPHFETPEDIANEKRISKEIVSYWKKEHNKPQMTWKKNPDRYPHDFCLLKDSGNQSKIIAIVEVKKRDDGAIYKTYLIAVEKFLSCISYSSFMGVPFFLVAEWTDGLGYYRYHEKDYPRFHFTWWKTKHERDGLDDEPGIHIPMNLFKKVR